MSVALLWCILGVWFAFVTRRIFQDGLAVHYVGSGESFFCLVILGTIGIVYWNKTARERLENSWRLPGDVLLATGGVVLFGLCYGVTGTDIPGGLLALARLYADRWKINFGTELGFASGNMDSAWPALEFLVLVALVVFLLMAIRKKRSIWLIGLPLALVGMGLLVNMKPRWESLALLFAGGVLAIYMDRVESIHWKHLGILLPVLLLIVVVMPKVMGPAAEHVNEIKGDFLSFQHELEQSIQDFDLQGLFSNNVPISNKAPEYEEKEVILLLMEKAPTDKVLLRGYHCDKYAGGAWERNRDAFARRCKEEGLEESEAVKMLLQQQYDVYEFLAENATEYRLKYTGLKEKTAYLPYGIDAGDTDAAYKLSGDYQATKRMSTKEYAVQSVGFTTGSLVFDVQNLTEQEKEFYRWYGDFVQENYMDVPDDQNTVKKLAQEIRSSAEYKETFQLYMDMLSFSPGSVDERRWSAVVLSELVTNRLKEEYTYSLELDELAPGQDPIEYFLGTSKEGYCVHFASAAVMILRELGVPARYASGYLVENNRIRRQDGMYAFSVKDSASHAWVEIYMEEYGWMPVDVTPGYSDTNINHVQDESEQEERQEQSETPESTPSEEEEIPEESTEEEVSEDVTEESADADVGLELGNGKGENGEGGSSGRGNKFILPLVLALLMILTGMIGWHIHKGRGIDRNRVNTYIRRGATRRAVLHMNYQIYRMVSGHKQKRKMCSDGEYFSLLQKLFPEVEKGVWEQYFEIVRRATYSIADISEEDVRECYKVYYEITQKEG